MMSHREYKQIIFLNCLDALIEVMLSVRTRENEDLREFVPAASPIQLSPFH